MTGLVWLAILALCGAGGLWWIRRDTRGTVLQPQPARCDCGRRAWSSTFMVVDDGGAHHPDGCGGCPGTPTYDGDDIPICCYCDVLWTSTRRCPLTPDTPR